MDWISSLPDDIIYHILSFHSTKEAALTSVLSKRWRNLFALLPNLRFEEKDFDYRDSDFGIPWSFIDFLERVLAVSGNSPLKKFSLNYRQNVVDSALINPWIRNVLSRGVLDLLDIDIITKSEFSLPLEVFSCKTLVKLKLGKGFVIAMVPENASLPSLKTLFLDCVRFYDHQHGCSFEALVSACHVLEEISIVGEHWEHWKWCRTVSSPTLQRLTIDCEGSNDSIRSDFRSITFDTPSLVYLKYSGFVSDKYPIVNLDALVEVKLTLALRKIPHNGNPTNLIKGLRNVEIMDLSSLETLKGPLHYNGHGQGIESVCQCLSGYNFLLSCPVKVLEITKFLGTKGELEQMKHLPEKLPCLELVKVLAYATDEEAKLKLAIDLLMLLRPIRIISTIKKFALKHRQRNDAARVNRWICNALSRGVLDLNLYIAGNYMYSLPLEVFSCKTIVNLKLGMNFSIGMVPENASLPALKTLFLDYIDFSGNFETLISGCHVLEELTMHDNAWDHWEQCRTVSCPTLRRLIMYCYGSKTFDLSRRKTVTDGYPIVNFDSIVEAKLILASSKLPQKGSPENLIKGLRNVEILELSSFQTSETFYSFRESIPVFKNLLHLSVTIDPSYCCRCLPFLLKNSPNLRTLLLKGPLHCDRSWHEPEPVCMCLSGLESCPVEVLEITEYKGTKDNLEHMKNFLEKLQCLELVKVCACETDDEKKLQLTNDLLRLRGPSKCKIQFEFIPS
ncbi:F-box-like domain superfamily [Arabidopsis suecica]|uniref:F-box-like domain superfamily n=1 Tax=Arabidopsis suecica TaxID=45249 RepID=A0A8T2A2Y3_ARASU|nr:F-box-like domain superfamily [Arabidopsis suecica]